MNLLIIHNVEDDESLVASPDCGNSYGIAVADRDGCGGIKLSRSDATRLRDDLNRFLEEPV